MGPCGVALYSNKNLDDDKSDQIMLEDVNVNVNETLTERNVSVNVNLTLI